MAAFGSQMFSTHAEESREGPAFCDFRFREALTSQLVKSLVIPGKEGARGSVGSCPATVGAYGTRKLELTDATISMECPITIAAGRSGY